MKRTILINLLGLILLINTNACLDRERIELLITQEVSEDEILEDRATLRGVIVDLRATSIQAHGFVWTDNPDASNDNLLIGAANVQVEDLGTRSDRGNFETTIRNLFPSTNYFVRSFVRTEAGTSYGNTISFTTKAINILKTDLTINFIAEITNNSALAEGTVARLTGNNILNHGICWSTEPSPEVTDNSSSLGPRTQTGNFTTRLNALAPSTRYYVRAYIETNFGVNYSENELIFTTASN